MHSATDFLKDLVGSPFTWSNFPRLDFGKVVTDFGVGREACLTMRKNSETSFIAIVFV